jgi:glycogen operon protein
MVPPSASAKIENWPGRPYPLGSAYDGGGTNFSLFSEVADDVELCLFDDDGGEERVRLDEVDAFCWHAYLPTVAPGQRYGYRVGAVGAAGRPAVQPGQAAARSLRQGHRGPGRLGPGVLSVQLRRRGLAQRRR